MKKAMNKDGEIQSSTQEITMIYIKL